VAEIVIVLVVVIEAFHVGAAERGRQPATATVVTCVRKL